MRKDAWACDHRYSRQEFEADVCMAGVLIAVMARRRLEIAGLVTNQAVLLQGFTDKKWANSHLAGVVTDTWEMIQLQSNKEQYPCNIGFDGLLHQDLSRDSVERLDWQWNTSPERCPGCG